MAQRFPDGARYAATEHAALGLGATAEEVQARYLAVAAALDEEPAAVPGTTTPLTGATLRQVTYGLLMSDASLPVLAQFWKAASSLVDGAPTEADTALLQQVVAPPPATPGVPADNGASAFLALVCGDADWPEDVSAYGRDVAADRAAWPLTAGMPANAWPCAFWADEPREAPVEVTDDGPRNVLVLQNRRDNATPWESGLGMRTALGSRAAFVGVDRGGHYVYGQGSSCADEVTTRFLTTGELPEEDVACPAP
jgi:hypothetical protein